MRSKNIRKMKTRNILKSTTFYGAHYTCSVDGPLDRRISHLVEVYDVKNPRYEKGGITGDETLIAKIDALELVEKCAIEKGVVTQNMEVLDEDYIHDLGEVVHHMDDGTVILGKKMIRGKRVRIDREGKDAGYFITSSGEDVTVVLPHFDLQFRTSQNGEVGYILTIRTIHLRFIEASDGTRHDFEKFDFEGRRQSKGKERYRSFKLTERVIIEGKKAAKDKVTRVFYGAPGGSSRNFTYGRIRRSNMPNGY